MATVTPTRSTLGQALSRRRSSPLPALLIGLGLVITVAFAILGYLESQRTEPVTVLLRDIPYGQQITAEDIGTITLPLHRPAQLAGIGDPAAVVGRYAARDLGANDVVQPAMLLDEPPVQPVFPNGQALTPNMVPLPFPTLSIGPLTHRDRVNIGYSDESGAPDLCDRARSAAAGERPTVAVAGSPLSQPRPYACRLISSLRVLYVDDAAGVAYLEVSPYQAHAIRALQAAGLELWGERYGASSEELPALDRLDIGQVTLDRLTVPVAVPSE
ncbi:MAG: SAF domain-containing protein [Chloroflexi bacterium OHK40]